MSFNNSSAFTINDGDLTNANRVYNNCNIHKNILATQRTVKRRTILDDYTRVKPGDMRIEENISTTSVRREYYADEEGRKQYQLWRDVDARRNIGIARLRGEDREDRFLCVTYDGPDALKAFKQDFDHFAHIKNANVAQIFGYNDNEQGLPALVFYEALIPLGRIVDDGYRFMPLLYSYFSHQFGRMQRELSVGELLLCELWVDPRTGALQKGPYLELPLLQSLIMLGTSENTMTNTHSTHLPIQTYGDNDTVFEYLTRTFPARTILTAIRFASSTFIQPLANEQVTSVLSSLPGVIYNRRSRDIIARLPGARERWHYGFWGVLGRIPDGMRESQVVMDDGSVRFTVMSTEIPDLRGIELQYLVYPGDEWAILVESWLTQTHSVFSQLGIHEGDWEDYGILDGFDLRLERTSPHKEPNIPPNVYLFIRPVPRPSDDEAIWRSWLGGEKYFWSFDPFGREMVPELVGAHLGLPSFTSGIVAHYGVWSPDHYTAIQKLHTSEGFDSTTTDFALSLGLPILEVIRDESRFEDLEDSSSNASSSAGDDLEPRGESPTRPSSAKKPSKAARTLQSTRTSTRLQQPQDIARNSTVNPSGKFQVPGKRVNSRDARPVSTRVKASERNLKTTGHPSVSIPTSATHSPQPIQAGTSGKKPAPAMVSVKRTNTQVGRAIDPSKRTKAHSQTPPKIGQPKPPSRQEAKKPVWR